MKELYCPSVRKVDFPKVDSERLYEEFQVITAHIPRGNLYRFSLNTAEGLATNTSLGMLGDTDDAQYQADLKTALAGTIEDQASHWLRFSPQNLLDPFQGTYFQEVVQQADVFFQTHGVKCGVIQLFEIGPNTCLPWHADAPAFYSVHIPVKTQEGCMFASEQGLATMLDAGSMYALSVYENKHTALNASNEVRVHLVFSVFSDLGTIPFITNWR